MTDIPALDKHLLLTVCQPGTGRSMLVKRLPGWHFHSRRQFSSPFLGNRGRGEPRASLRPRPQSGDLLRHRFGERYEIDTQHQGGNCGEWAPPPVQFSGRCV